MTVRFMSISHFYSKACCISGLLQKKPPVGDFTKLKLSRPLTKDTVNFSNNFHLFGKNDRDIKLILKKSINPDNKIGEGTEAILYKIPDSQFALRLPLNNQVIPDKPVSLNINPQDSVNHVVAKIGDEVTIVKYLKGDTPQAPYKKVAGVPEEASFLSKYKFDSEKQSQINESIINMPVNSFKTYIGQLYNATKNGMRHDSVGENAIINPQSQTLIAVDFVKTENPKVAIFDRIFEQFGKHIDTKEQQDTLLKKSTLGFLEIIKPKSSATITNFDVSFDKFFIFNKFKNKELLELLEKKLPAICEKRQQYELNPHKADELYDEIVKFEALIS